MQRVEPSQTDSTRLPPSPQKTQYLSSANLVANVFVLVGLFACIAWSCVVLARDGPASDVQLFNHHDCWLFLGAVAVSFEGMSLVLPIKVRGGLRPGMHT